MTDKVCDYNFNIDLYSRQLGIIDSDSMKKLTSMKYLIIGLRGLGIEILKNLILEGPQRVDIYDPNYINIYDLNSNYFVTEEDINKIRDETIIEKIKDLNPYVKSDIIKQRININEKKYENELEFILTKIKDYNMIILTEFVSKNTINKINSECKKLNKGLIYSCALGLCGFLFNYFGKEHIITSPAEKNDTFYPIKNIIKGEQTTIQLENSLENFPYIIEDNFIKLSDLNGIKEINTDKIYKVVKRESFSEYKIDLNSSNFSDYTYGGFLQVITLPIKMNFRCFEEDIFNPLENKENDFMNIPYIGRNDIVHSLIISLNRRNYINNEAKNKNKRSYIIDEDILPKIDDEKFQREIIETAKNFYNDSKNKKENWIQLEDIYDETSQPKEFDEKMASNLCLYLKNEIPPITSFLGGVVAQEAIKLTGRFTPFNQWFEFEFNYLSPKREKLGNNYQISRYTEQIQIFGEETQKKLNSLKIFLVGVGAIGCEYLKNFAMMGISNKEGVLTITDFDKIEISNLNRQFLFRENNINQYKSEVAGNYIKQMNDSINIFAYKNYVGIETENIFTDQFWDEQDIIFNAVDNVKARFYLNDKVCIHQKYHFDAGTLGVNSSCGFYMKNLSSTYKEQNGEKKEEDDNNNIRENGMCTIHSFPTCIKHCIEWARNEYEYLFTGVIKELNQILKGDVLYFYKILTKKMFPFYKKLKIKEMTDLFEIFITKNYIKAIEYSYEYFMNKFNLEIKKILDENPENSKDKEGKNIYSGSKHVPLVLHFDINSNIDNLIINYIKSFANLIFDCLGLCKNELEKNICDNDIRKICINSNLSDYESTNIKSLKSEIIYNKEYCQVFIQSIQQKLKDKNYSLDNIKFNEINFEKDSKNINQYKFIYSCSNLRAINFQIPQIDFIKVKNIASNIIPSIITSNAVITGLVTMQLYLLAFLMVKKEKYNNNLLETNDSLLLFRNYYIDLGNNNYSFGYLPKKIIIETAKGIPIESFSVWDSIIIKGPLSMGKIIEMFKEKYKVSILSVFSGKSMIFNVVQDEKDKYEQNFEDLYEKVTGAPIPDGHKYLLFELDAKTLIGQETLFPRIKYLINYK